MVLPASGLRFRGLEVAFACDWLLRSPTLPTRQLSTLEHYDKADKARAIRVSSASPARRDSEKRVT
jgi:hypothetical protein